MAETYFPYDTASVNEQQWRDMARYFMASGVILNNFNAPSLQQGLLVYGDSSGRQVKINIGDAWVDGHKYNNSTLLTKAIAANASGNPRIDVVVLRSDRTAKNVTVQIIQGTPAASPVAPAITITGTVWDIKLAHVFVGNAVATINAGDVTDQRPIAAGIDGIPGNKIKLLDQTLVSSGGLQALYIPPTFRQLRLCLKVRSNYASAAFAGLRYQFNSDGGTNYFWQRIFGNNTTPTAERATGQTNGSLGDIPAATATANLFSIYEAVIGNYADVGSYKAVSSHGGYSQSLTTPFNFHAYSQWFALQAINRIDVFDDHSSAGLAAGSQLTVYGEW